MKMSRLKNDTEVSTPVLIITMDNLQEMQDLRHKQGGWKTIEALMAASKDRSIVPDEHRTKLSARSLVDGEGRPPHDVAQVVLAALPGKASDPLVFPTKGVEELWPRRETATRGL